MGRTTFLTTNNVYKPISKLKLKNRPKITFETTSPFYCFLMS